MHIGAEKVQVPESGSVLKAYRGCEGYVSHASEMLFADPQLGQRCRASNYNGSLGA
jgi:hypothetical protein